MELRQLLEYKNILLQCHDIPDADTIACGFALQDYLNENGCNAKIIYGGPVKINKINLVMMLDILKIDIEHVSELPEHDLLITVDCQYGARNVMNFPTDKFLVIDHHRAEIDEGEHTCIRPSLGSCATLVWDLLRQEGYDFEKKLNVGTALYYGLFSDTNNFAELNHPLDRDMAELINCDLSVIKKLKNSAITLPDLDIVGNALGEPDMIESICIFKARPCDPNILGFTSDIAQQVSQIDCCIVCCELPHGLKLSIRSSCREIMANEIAEFLARGVGGGGGNIEKAGGFISFADIKEKHGEITPMDFLRKRVREYIDNYDMIYCDNHNVDFDSAKRYKKMRIPCGFAKTSDLYPLDTPVTFRTLEGDIDARVSEDTYVMIGILGEVYPILREKFERTYEIMDGEYNAQVEYLPTVTNKITGEKIAVMPHARVCLPKGDKIISAIELTRDTKVFSYWDLEKYFYGTEGDFLAANVNDYNDVYIIRRDIFFKTYEPYEVD